MSVGSSDKTFSWPLIGQLQPDLSSHWLKQAKQISLLWLLLKSGYKGIFTFYNYVFWSCSYTLMTRLIKMQFYEAFDLSLLHITGFFVLKQMLE